MLLSLAVLVACVLLPFFGATSESYIIVIAVLCIAGMALGSRVHRVMLTVGVLAMSIMAIVFRPQTETDLPFAYAAMLALLMISPVMPLWSRLPVTGLVLAGAILAMVRASLQPSPESIVCVVAASAMLLCIADSNPAAAALGNVSLLASSALAVVVAATTYMNITGAGKKSSTGWIGFGFALLCMLVGIAKTSILRASTFVLVLVTVMLTFAHRKIAAGKQQIGDSVGLAFGTLVLVLGLGIALRSLVVSMNSYENNGGVQGGRTSIVNAMLLLGLAALSSASLGGKVDDPPVVDTPPLPPSAMNIEPASLRRRKDDVQERVYRLSPAIAAIGVAAGSGESPAAWVAASVVAAATFLSDRLAVHPPTVAVQSSRATAADECDDRCKGKGVICLAACRNKCAKSYCAYRGGVDFPTSSTEALLGLCTTHAAEYNRAIAIPEHRRSPAQQQCVSMHEFDSCIETLCRSVAQPSSTPSVFTRSDADKMKDSLVDDTKVQETEAEFMARISSNRLQS